MTEPTPHKVLVRHLEDDHRFGRVKHLSLTVLQDLHAQAHESPGTSGGSGGAGGSSRDLPPGPAALIDGSEGAAHSSRYERADG